MVYLTRGLRDVLLEMAAEHEPEKVNVVLEATPAASFEGGLDDDIGPDTPILTHFYLPEAGQSVAAVFGMDLGTPAGRGRARFLSHPQGPKHLTERDDFAAVVVVAVPPWRPDDLRAYGRNGTRVDLRIVDAEPPTETVE